MEILYILLSILIIENIYIIGLIKSFRKIEDVIIEHNELLMSLIEVTDKLRDRIKKPLVQTKQL